MKLIKLFQLARKGLPGALGVSTYHETEPFCGSIDKQQRYWTAWRGSL